MNYREVNKKFKNHCFKNNCKNKIVGDFAYKNKNRLIRFISCKNNIIKIYDSKNGYIDIIN